MSRLKIAIFLALSAPTLAIFDDIKREQAEAPELRILKDSTLPPGWATLKGLYLYEDSPVSLPSHSYNGQPMFRPVAILSTRKKMIQQSWVPQSLVQWEGLPIEEETWVSDNELSTIFLDIHLEDKVVAEGEGIVAVEDGPVVEEVSQKSYLSNKEAAEGSAQLDNARVTGELRKSKRTTKKPVWMQEFSTGQKRKK
ncbi:hypothetical protein POM88_028859 [Heracleum sosnowskyi]|uniref:Uncharacterized protein n=1 Tax=Heracleum sosnowskyi TaxID=360622 RepID=A0AAD8HT09_9APIA|nr:hypothetical protein POM88_028859 [Heracleum sosnowskyi]